MGSSASKSNIVNQTEQIEIPAVAESQQILTNNISTVAAVSDNEENGKNQKRKTKEETLTFIEEKLCELNKIDEKWKNEGKEIFKLLTKTYYAFGKSIAIDIGDLMVKHNFVSSCNTLWEHYLGYEDLNSAFLKFKTIYFMKLVLWNYTDKSKNLCKEMFRTRKIVEKCMAEFSTPQLNIEELKKDEKRFHIKATFGILLNVVRHCNETSSIIRQNNGLTNLLEYQKSSYLIIKAKVMILLAYCVNEEESEKLMTGSGVISFILKLLKSALNSPKHIAKTYMFSATETIEGLDRLALNDNNKQAMVVEGILPMIKELMVPDGNKEEHEAAMHCLWTLSFHPDNKDKIKQEEGLLNAIKVISQDQTSTKSTLKSCEGLLFVLEEKTQATNKNVTSGKHVMISYQWNVQPIILLLRDYLKANEFKVWIDVDEAKGSILSAMADAVESASVVIVCLTENYKNSNPCRTEAEYAYKLSKPIIPLLLEESYSPDGWLGALLGMQLYIDISTHNLLEKGYPQISQSINNKIGISNETVKIEKSASHQSAIKQSNSAISNWTSEDVKKWANKTNIRGLETTLAEFDGNSLLQLQKLLKRCPEMYYSFIKTDLHLSLVEILKFTHEMENL